MFDRLDKPAHPEVTPVPEVTRGSQLRIDLRDTQPPVWRRIEVPGDLTLNELHEVVQRSMGWTNSHLHRFQVGPGYDSPCFVTRYDVEMEGEDGVLEDDVRLDQVVATKGDALRYEYDFGDGWRHSLKVEKVLDTAPDFVRCIGVRLACPPEDCGGVGGYADLAAWVRSGHDDALLPCLFDTAADAHRWLPDGWDPDRFGPEDVNDELALITAEPVAVSGHLVEIAEEFDRHGITLLREVLARPGSHGTSEVAPDEAARLTEAYRILLDALGDGVDLTAAGWLPPRIVAQVAEATGIAGWHIGKNSREDQTYPVAMLRDSARALGLLSVRKGRIALTSAVRKAKCDPVALWRHIVTRLPLGSKEREIDAGWLTLAVVASDAPPSEWRAETSVLLGLRGWRSTHRPNADPRADNPTLEVLGFLGGQARAGWRDTDELAPGIGATARAVLHLR
ncbi:plasmid pRiA4b ORF-3 family protein [Xylanimonas oleitrophica]|uniref:Plasmid pRiA4b ORF-3 family protein n=1 Tax=Xylanimonas oleitrophica TaxID=2607479 RepID=A0A2W5Y3N3_9MICO|nr:plasmid pRiA4b ORF-3 family protein [Xylanimonas oleitrophica]